MDAALIGAFSAVGLPGWRAYSFLTTHANQRAQYRRDFLSRQFAQRENLYSEFIMATEFAAPKTLGAVRA